jgi:hypothetical protein
VMHKWGTVAVMRAGTCSAGRAAVCLTRDGRYEVRMGAASDGMPTAGLLMSRPWSSVSR